MSDEKEDNPIPDSNGGETQFTSTSFVNRKDENGGEHVTEDDTSSDRSEVVVSPHNSSNTSQVVVEGEDEDDEDGIESEEFQDTHQPSTTMRTTTRMATKTPSLIWSGLQGKETPYGLKSWNSMALTLDGRDKMTKLFQYLCRFLSWWFAGRGKKLLAIRFADLSTSLSNSRKAFRLGRSFIEVEKLYNVGIGRLIMEYVQKCRKIDSTVDLDDGDNIKTQEMVSTDDTASTISPSQESSLVESASLGTYKIITRPFRWMVSSIMGKDYDSLPKQSTTTADLWMAVGSAVKLLGLFGFWTGDNINFLSSTGFLDNHSVPDTERLAKRTRLATLASIRANQAYFGGSMAGLFVNAYAYIRFRRTKVTQAEQELKAATCRKDGPTDDDDDDDSSMKEARKRLVSIRKEEFSLALALLKSCCDIIVFSNNPGIDLHQKYRGKKNNEGLHCVCGLVSAGTVLFNNFPDKKY